MIVYTFDIASLKKKTVNGVENTVFSVVWEKTGYDPDGYTGSFKISTQLDVSGVGIGTGYIDYDSLTKQDVINWIKSLTNEEDVNEVIAEGIQRSRDRETKVESGDFPWGV